MNFDLTPEQQALADSVIRFVEREYDWETRTKVIRSDTGLEPSHWATFAELGWLGAGLSEEAGGFGGSAIENAVIAQELGKGLVTEPFAAHVVASRLLSAPAAVDTASLVEPLIIGEMRVAVAVQEPDARGDFRTVAAQYERADGGYRLQGRKSLVDGALVADTIVIPATGADGLALFIVDAAAQGVARKPYRLLDNRRVCDVSIDMAVPADAMLLAGNAAADAWDSAIDHGNLVLCAEALGIMEAALWQTRDYLQTRKQFGLALAQFQALQHRMADMLIELEMTRSLMFHALGAMEGDAGVRRAAVSALKVQSAKAGHFIGSQAIQLHGGIGVTEELPISHYYRRLYVIARTFGDAELHADRFALALDTEQGAVRT